MIRRFLTRVLIVILIAVCGYNIWQVQQLRAQVAHLQAMAETRSTHLVKAPPVLPSEGFARSARGWLDVANSHLTRARAAISRGDFGTARAELDHSLDAMHQAAAVPQAETRQIADRGHRQLAAMQRQFAALQAQVNALLPREQTGH